MTLYEFSVGDYIQYKDSTWLIGKIFRLEPDGGYSIIRTDNGLPYYILGSQTADCHIYTPSKELVTTTGEKCVGYNLYKYYYINGTYTRKELIENNSPTCGYVAPTPDPCAGVECSNSCYLGSTSLYSRKCVGGQCVKDDIVKLNAPECGYTAPKFSVGDHICTDQSELSGWAPATINELYADGSYKATTDSGTPFKLSLDWEQYYYKCAVDPCARIYCPDKCDGTSLYSQKCVDGVCVKDALIEANSPTCGYVPPYDEPDDIIDDGPDDEVRDLMPGQTCVGSDLHQLITGGMIGDLIEANSPKCPSAPPEDEGIFGDLNTKWIIIAVIGIILLGLLS